MSAGVATTYKAREVEEIIDLAFYRPVGYRLAVAADRMHITPNMLTIVGIIIGMVAGHFFFYESLALNAIGMGLWVISNMFDSADGQLARMTGQATQLGRILDGFGGNLVFLSIYVHICLHYALNGGAIGWWVFLVSVLAGVSHSIQSSMADYYRNSFLRFGVQGAKGELDYSSEVRERYNKARWIGSFWNKLFLRFYLNYCVQQEQFSPKFQVLRETIRKVFGSSIPEDFASEYRRLNKPLLKYYNFLTINGRVLTLFGFVLIGYPELFFVIELTAFNLLLWAVLHKQEQNNAALTSAARQVSSAAHLNNKEVGVV